LYTIANDIIVGATMNKADAIVTIGNSGVSGVSVGETVDVVGDAEGEEFDMDVEA
jgi:hypothetical protein